MIDKNNILKYLVPIVAVVVLVESVVLISKLNDRPEVVSTPSQEVVVESEVTTTEAKKESPLYDFVVSTESKDIKLGEKAVVEVKIKGVSSRSVDALNVYLKYNQAAFEASDLTFDKKLPKPAFEKISTLRSLIVANFLVTEPKGLILNASDEISVMKFTVTPKMTGKFDFEISTGDELKESVTMIIENATGKVLPYSSNKLTVNVSR